MAKTVLRQFTGGLSDEIDAQNLREDQGQEALDINLKGFSLEPGDSSSPVTDAGHYHYRGEWIKDSKAISFEESGIGVIKTYDEKRPEFEEIIKDDVNISRSLGPPLPPGSEISGTIVSEGTRGERPAEGSHLLKLEAGTLGGVDKVNGSTPAPSLKTHQADISSDTNDIHYYNGQAYWIVKSGSNWSIRTRAWSSSLSDFTSSYITSTTLTHHSSGHFFKDGHFVCWDAQYIETVPLSNTSMTSDVLNTIDPSDGGDAGSSFSKTTGATANSISGLDITNGTITFSQKITTANTTPTAYSGSADERWLRMPTGNNGCFVLLLRDGMADSDSESHNTGTYSNAPDPEVWTQNNQNVFPGWTDPTGELDFVGGNLGNENGSLESDLSNLGNIDFGIKYAVVFAENDTWVKVKYGNGTTNCPEIMVIPNAWGDKNVKSGELAAKEVTATRQFRSERVGYFRRGFASNPEEDQSFIGEEYWLYRDFIDVTLTFNTVQDNNKIHWIFEAPVATQRGILSGLAKASSYAGIKGVYPIARNFYYNINDAKVSAGAQIIVAEPNGSNPAGSWTRYLGGTSENTRDFWKKSSGSLGRNDVTTNPVPGEIKRLFKYTPGGSITHQTDFSVSKLWTKATIASSDNSITFVEGTPSNFRVGDWIKIGQNGTNKSIHLNLRGNAYDVNGVLTEQSFITARIVSFGTSGKIFLSPPEIDTTGDTPIKKQDGNYLDEECYPVISTFITYDEDKQLTTDTDGANCSVIKSDLTSHVLVGHQGRKFKDKSGQFIEVRASGGAAISSSSSSDYTHRIDWVDKDIRAVTELSNSKPRIFYWKEDRIFSQDGSDKKDPTSISLSSNGKYFVDKNYFTHVDNNGVTVYSIDFENTHYVKGSPELNNGLGLTGNVIDAKTYVTSLNAVYVVVKIGDYWKIVKTTSSGPESSLLTYDFLKPLAFDGSNIWGISTDSTSGYDVETVKPFYESDIVGSWIFYANDYTTLTPSTSAWGQVVKSRIGEKEDLGTPRYLSVDWKMDSGNWFVTGTPTIGLNHEANKMVGIKTFKWYPLDAPQTLASSGTATVISNISNNTYLPLASLEIKFDSNVIRDIVFFKQSETLLPASGETGGESKISFSNYAVASQEFYVLTAQAFEIVTEKGKEPEWAYRLGQSNVSADAFDASRVGTSTFQVGAPNMFNPYGANIDFFYRASFINKWGHESTPSPLASKGITPLDSSDDCVQLNFNLPFFRFDDTDIEKIRIYRYGGDSSEFLHLSDIEMPTLPVDANGRKYFPSISGISTITNGFSRKSASSPYYLLKTYKDISSLFGFVNSNFLFTATPSTMDGSWRVNQIREVASPSTTHTSKLAKDIDITDTTVELVNGTGWPSAGVIKVDNEYISYSGKTGNSLTGIAHGLLGENPSLHKSGYIKSVSLTSGGGQWGQDSGGSGSAKYKTNDCLVTFQNIDGYLAIFPHSSASSWEFLNTTNGLGYAFELKVLGGNLPKGLSQNTVYQSSLKSNALGNSTTGGYFITPLNNFEESGKVGVPHIYAQSHAGFAGFQNRILVSDNDLGSGSFYMQANIFCVPQYIRKIYSIQEDGGHAQFSITSSFIRPYGENFKVNERVRFRIGGLPVSAVTGPTNISGNFQASLTSANTYQTSSSGSGVYAKFTIASDGSSNLTATITDGGYGYKVGDTITITDPGNTSNTATLTVSGVTGTVPTLPTGFAEDTDYWIHTVTNATALSGSNHTGKVKLKATESGAAMTFTGSSPFGSTATFNTTSTTGGIWLYSANTAETGSDFYGRYTVNGTTGVIDNTLKIINPGEGYAEVPSQIGFFQSQDTGATGSSNEAEASCTHANGVSPTVVEWELEMEHRNQDTTTLEEEIVAPLSGSSNVITVKDTSVFPAASSSGSPGPKKILIGNEVLTYTGKTDTTFTGVTGGVDSTTASAHGLGVRVLSYDESYATTTVSNGIIEIEGFGYRDKSRTPISSVYSMQEDNWPPLGLEYNEKLKQFYETESEDDYFRYIKAVGGIYFGALDSNLRFSRYGSPEYWPLDAVITLDSEIRSIQEHSGEGIVFTTNSVYRVRGTDPKAMVSFRVPDAKGIPVGYEHTVSDFNGGLIWLTASDGIAIYQSGRITYLTRDKHNIGALVKPYSCVVDGVYWLFQEPGSGAGYKLDLSSGDMRLAKTSIEAYYAYFAKALGVGVVVTKDNILNPSDTEFVVEEVGASKASNIKWKSKKIDVGEPAIPKALGSLAIVYESLSSSSSETTVNGIRGQALAAQLLGLDPDDLNAGDIITDESVTTTELYDIFTKYDQPNQNYVVDLDGTVLNSTQRRTVLMPVNFDINTVTVGDRVWNDLLADNTVVESLTTTSISGTVYPSIVLDKEPLKSGTGILYWGKLPLVQIYLNEDETPSRSFTLPPGDSVEPQSMDLYLNDLKRFRTISVSIEGDLRVQALSIRHYPLQSYQSASLHHSADVFYKGDIDFRVLLDGNLVYRKQLNNAGDDFKEERIYLPASTYGQRAHYMNESRSGMIESVKFNGTLAA